MASPLSVGKLIAAVVRRVLVRRMILTDIKRACIISFRKIRWIEASNVRGSIVPREKRSGRVWIISSHIASGCIRRRTSTSSSNSQPSLTHRDCSMMLISPRSEVEPSKVLPFHADGPRFSSGSKASESEDADENRRMGSSSVHSSELLVEPKSRAPSTQVAGAKWRHSLATSVGSINPVEPEKPGSITGRHHDELQRSVNEQAKKEPMTRANTGSTIQVDTEQYGGINPDHDQRPPLEDQPSSDYGTGENDFRPQLHANDQQPSFTSKSYLTNLISPMFKIKAQEISRAVASEVSDCLNNTRSSQEDIELIVQTRVMSLLNESNPKKRKSSEIELEDSAQPNAKRITCSICPKTVGRPCDLK